MGASTHPTTKPAQTETDTFAVFGTNPQDPSANMVLIKRVEIPRYAVPNNNGSKLSRDQRLQMAVQFAVTAEDSYVYGPVEGVEGDTFYVMDDLESRMEPVAFEQNPAVAGCWNPNQESAAEFAGVSDE